MEDSELLVLFGENLYAMWTTQSSLLGCTFFLIPRWCQLQISTCLEHLPETEQQQMHLPSAFPGYSDGKESACNAGEPDLIPGRGRFPGEKNCNPLQCSCLENSMDRGAWWAAVSVHFNSVQCSHPVTFNSLRTYGLQHARLPWPASTPRACSNLCPSSRWCYPTVTGGKGAGRAQIFKEWHSPKTQHKSIRIKWDQDCRQD